MRIKDKYLFQQLKKEIVVVMRQSYPGISENISDWKGQDITDFQDELGRKVSEQISEKWFYTHMKVENDTLPRIDVLNFLSRFSGYKNWDDFRHSRKRSKNRPGFIKPAIYFILLPVLTILILISFYFAYQAYSTREYVFCFYNAESGQPIENTLIEVSLIRQGESPETLLCDRNGCMTIETDLSTISITVIAPYFHTETIVRNLDRSNRTEKVMLRENKYARMIHQLSMESIEDLQERKYQLNQIIDENALIYLVSDSDPGGISIINKLEFIDLILANTEGNRQIEVLETKYKDGKINILRFRQVKQ